MCMRMHVRVHGCTSLRILFINSLITIQVQRSSASLSLSDWVEVWMWSIDQLPGDRSYWLWLIQLFIFEPMGLTSIDRHTPRSRQGVQPCVCLKLGLHSFVCVCVCYECQNILTFFFLEESLSSSLKGNIWLNSLLARGGPCWRVLFALKKNVIIPFRVLQPDLHFSIDSSSVCRRHDKVSQGFWGHSM